MGETVTESVSAASEAAINTFSPCWLMLYIGVAGRFILPGNKRTFPRMAFLGSVLCRKTKRVPSTATRTPPKSDFAPPSMAQGPPSERTNCGSNAWMNCPMVFCLKVFVAPRTILAYGCIVVIAGRHASCSPTGKMGTAKEHVIVDATCTS